jgi:hypothetical protein
MSTHSQPVADAEYIGTDQPEGLVEDLTGSTVLPPALPPMVSTPTIRGAIDGEVMPTGSVDRIRRYVDAAEKLIRGSLAMQVMAGFELSELHKRSPFSHGGKRRSSSQRANLIGVGTENPALGDSSSHVANLIDPTFAGHSNWADYVQQTFGVSYDTARRWMAMADAARSRLKRLDGWSALVKDLLDRPITALSEREMEVLNKGVQKLTDGRSQMDFLVELGLAKKPGNPSLGGNTGGRPASSGVIEGEALIKAATEDWAQAHRALIGGQCGFTVLSDAEIEAQLDTLTRALRVRREWLAAPANKRTQALVDTLAKTLA